jgi:hypothetical protein
LPFKWGQKRGNVAVRLRETQQRRKEYEQTTSGVAELEGTDPFLHLHSPEKRIRKTSTFLQVE